MRRPIRSLFVVVATCVLSSSIACSNGEPVAPPTSPTDTPPTAASDTRSRTSTNTPPETDEADPVAPSRGVGGSGGTKGTAGDASPSPSAPVGMRGMSESMPDTGKGDVEAELPPFEGEGDPWIENVPRATCGEGDMPETGLHGDNGDIRCNLLVHGQANAPHFLSHAWHKHCAYVNGQAGTTVLDVSDSANPKVTTTLTTTGMQSNWETMKVSERSGLLVGYQSEGPVLDVYDVSQDCTQPVLQVSHNLGGSGHAGQFSTDGTIYYASSLYTMQVFAVDLMNPKMPEVITSEFDGRNAHDLFIGKEGNRGYFAFSNLNEGLGVGMVAIIDTSRVQSRDADAAGTVIHEWSWPDGNVSQYPILVSYRGRDHLLISDELGSGNCNDPEKPPYGYARIFDIQDEKNPVLVSKIKTEAVGPCTGMPVGDGFFGVGTHYCNVDRLEDPRLFVCGFWDGGVRVFDVRNPWRPKEVAYFDTEEANVPGLVRILPEARELWLATVPSTFYVLKLAGGVWDEILKDDEPR